MSVSPLKSFLPGWVINLLFGLPKAFIILGLFSLILFFFVENVFLRAFLLLLGIRFGLGIGSIFLNILHYLPISYEDFKRLITSVSAGSFFLFLFFHSESLFWKSLLLVIFLLGPFQNFFKILHKAINEVIFGKRILYKHFKDGNFPNDSILIYFLSQPNLQWFYAQKFLSEISLELNKKSLNNQFLYFIIEDRSIEAMEEEYKKWIIANAHLIIILRRPMAYENEEFEDKILKCFEFSLGKISALYLDQKELIAAFESNEENILAPSYGYDMDITNMYKPPLSGSASLLKNHLISTVLPNINFDNSLPKSLSKLKIDIAYKAIPPVGTSYLRFRLAQSDVERFLCLMDCIEVLIKFSAIILISSDRIVGLNKNNDEIASILQRPSLGHWIGLLRTLINIKGDYRFRQILREVWTQPLNQAPIRLIDESAGSGMAWKGTIPRSHLEWLDWFVNLRNKTRGHGKVEEDKVSSLLPDFHETYLYLVLQLSDLVFGSTILLPKDEKQGYALEGWQRSIYSNYSEDSNILELSKLYFVNEQKETDLQLVTISPLMIYHSKRLLFWNRTDSSKKVIEYIDYGSGKMVNIKTLEFNPFKIQFNTTYKINQHR